MSINCFFENIESFILNKNIYSWISKAIENENKQPGEINIIFCSDEHLLKMNIEHLNHNFYTDIITFDYSEKEIVSGDLFISKDRVGENAIKFNVSFADEIHRVIIHGILHLCGYNDKKEEQKVKMRERENYYLGKISQKPVNQKRSD
ncbi:MAG: rRNA maturation RNase YbeY [Bacteroidales bacterium]|nr:rRNA maturation RNase YbeY [Bacteroidales bacterium]